MRAQIIGRAVEAAPATLRDYERRRARYFYVVKRHGASVAGLMLSGLTAADLTRLDEYEEAPLLYTREAESVTDQNGDPMSCWVYLPTARGMMG